MDVLLKQSRLASAPQSQIYDIVVTLCAGSAKIMAIEKRPSEGPDSGILYCIFWVSYTLKLL
jgi:hypothetical protein